MSTRQRNVLGLAGVLLLLSGLTGCVFGPASLAAGRGVYNEVVNRTEDEQLLNIIVRERYGETFGLLAVSSVTANIRASANVSSELGFGPQKNYDGNLVPLQGGMAFEENPTISYVPVGGKKFVLKLLSPLTIEEAMFVGRYLVNERASFMEVMLARINGVRNPLDVSLPSESERFERIIELWENLRYEGALQIGRDPECGLAVAFLVKTPAQEATLAELLELSGIRKRPVDDRLILPLRGPGDEWTFEGFNYETRSVKDILRTAGDCIEIPDEHLRAGVVEPLREGVEPRLMKIHTSRIRPGGTGTIAIPYRGWWYYVDDADPASKRAFVALRLMVALRLSDEDKEHRAPVLTIPVG